VQNGNVACVLAEDIDMSPPVDPVPSTPAPTVNPAIDAASSEVELKFTTDASGFAMALASQHLKASESDARSRALTSVYFDTLAGDLKRHGMVLRVRRAGRCAPVMTLKWKLAEAQGPFARGEIEIPTRGLEPNLSLFDDTIAAKLKGLIEDRPLTAQFETRIKRRTRLLHVGASQIEVAFDDGVIVAGERSWPVTEIELELKSGEARDLYELGGRLAEALPVKLDVISKSDRAFALASNETPASVKTSPLRFPPNAMLDDAVAVVLASTLNHFVLNWAALREGDHPESIHQMRVALRRLRAALAMFKRALPCAEFDVFRAEAKRIATALGPARECGHKLLVGISDPVHRIGQAGAAGDRKRRRERIERVNDGDRQRRGGGVQRECQGRRTGIASRVRLARRDRVRAVRQSRRREHPIDREKRLTVSRHP